MKVYIVQHTSEKQPSQSVTFDDGHFWKLSTVQEKLMSIGFGVGQLYRLVHGAPVFYADSEYNKKYRGKYLYYQVLKTREDVLDDVYEAILLNNKTALCRLIPAVFSADDQSDKFGTPLDYAFNKDRLLMFRLLIELGATISQSDEEVPLIHRAVVRDDISYVSLLIEHGADPNQRYHGLTLLYWAKSVSMMTYLINNGTDVNPVIGSGKTLLHVGVSGENMDLVQFLISKGVNPNEQDLEGRTPLMGTTNLAIVTYLLEHGANIDSVDRRGRGVLHYIIHGDYDLVHFLISRGANPNCRDIDNITPLMVAKDIEIMTCLLENGADINAIDSEGLNVLHHNIIMDFVYSGCFYELVQFLISKGVNLNLPVKDGVTPLMLAGNIPMMTCLVENGANINATDINGRNILYRHINTTNTNLEHIQFLLSKGVNVNTSDIQDYTPLMVAARHGKLDIVKLLLEYEADKSARDINGQTAEQIAHRNGYDEVASLIRDFEDIPIKEPEY